jgi:hypothetical protein
MNDERKSDERKSDEKPETLKIGCLEVTRETLRYLTEPESETVRGGVGTTTSDYCAHWGEN